MWCIEGIKIVSSKFAIVLNRLITATMLVAMLFACQQMPENNSDLQQNLWEQPER